MDFCRQRKLRVVFFFLCVAFVHWFKTREYMKRIDIAYCRQDKVHQMSMYKHIEKCFNAFDSTEMQYKENFNERTDQFYGGIYFQKHILFEHKSVHKVFPKPFSLHHTRNPKDLLRCSDRKEWDDSFIWQKSNLSDWMGLQTTKLQIDFSIELSRRKFSQRIFAMASEARFRQQ